ncbi:hypothetical protein KEU06_09270 [Pseudaminobacter sp. 19-2017]|uniref:Uncharacterized protein n=1 Tax=Pseudaminobacter soli (ex Zhang et al. 2022) TaxID=2831468 RepID=A0A942DWP3_9HYPH|nr:hypothetical protein [Pseudaminobacter soli]MBS3648794.1 hypothetical protein [Pseudaminobacter soli]
MNRKDRTIAAGLAARWEWGSTSSGPEAAAKYACAKDLIEELAIPAEDLSFARAWEIAERMQIKDDEALMDVLNDMVDDDYKAVVDMIEDFGFDGLKHEITKRATA